MRTRRPRPAPIARSAFAGFRFPLDIIVLAVRWYLRFGLSYRDVEELLAEHEPSPQERARAEAIARRIASRRAQQTS